MTANAASTATTQVASFHHAASGTLTHVVYDQEGGHAAVIDPVLDYDSATACTSLAAVQPVIDFLDHRRLQLAWVLETHAHADHLSCGGWLAERYGAPLAIGAGIVAVQQRCKVLFGLGDDFVADGRQFDRLLVDGDTLAIGSLQARVIATPGHTGDSLSYVIGDAAFIGDTLFAPDSGTARCDFPGGDAGELYDSIHRLLGLPAATRLFLCHDYLRQGRALHTHASVAEQQAGNVHVGGARAREQYIALRQARDAGLPEPALILPALQVNIRGSRR
jgi:glyoxylase-like metal-dependent hydrolase (beta-lactamase superfamily II)